MGTLMKVMHRRQSGSSHPQIINHPGQRQGLALVRVVQDRLHHVLISPRFSLAQPLTEAGNRKPWVPLLSSCGLAESTSSHSVGEETEVSKVSDGDTYTQRMFLTV